VHPGVGHSRIADAPGGAWTNERHVSQKKFFRVGTNAPLIEAGWATMPVDMGQRFSTPSAAVSAL
jgi:hypothetical protein